MKFFVFFLLVLILPRLAIGQSLKGIQSEKFKIGISEGLGGVNFVFAPALEFKFLRSSINVRTGFSSISLSFDREVGVAKNWSYYAEYRDNLLQKVLSYQQVKSHIFPTYFMYSIVANYRFLSYGILPNSFRSFDRGKFNQSGVTGLIGFKTYLNRKVAISMMAGIGFNVTKSSTGSIYYTERIAYFAFPMAALRYHYYFNK